MNKTSVKNILFFIIGLLTAFLVMYFLSNYKVEKKNSSDISTVQKHEKDVSNGSDLKKTEENNKFGNDIEKLTEEKTIISYVKQHHELPDYYLTKNEAKKQGWNPSKGNLCDVLPGKAIGGDHFSNREKTLPSVNQYFEADVNYNCGNRNADRIIFTKNGEVWLTKNHYKTFEKQ